MRIHGYNNGMLYKKATGQGIVVYLDKIYGVIWITIEKNWVDEVEANGFCYKVKFYRTCCLLMTVYSKNNYFNCVPKNH